MKPQERIAAIFASHLEPSEKLLLVALASYMRDDMLAAWPAPESLAELTGLSVSTTKALLTGMVARGAITRTDEGRRAKVTRICWEALPALVAKPAGRGGRRSPGEGSDDRTEPSDVRTVESDNRTATVRCSDGKGSDNRTRTDQGTDQEPTTSVGGGDRTREDAPPAPVQVETPQAAPEPDPTPPDLDLPTLLDGDSQLLAPLVSAGITTVEALCALTAAEVRHRPGIGPKRLLAITAALERAGLSLAPDVTPERRAPVERPGLRRLTDGWGKAYLDTTGQAYRWTPTGRNSDQRAAFELYDAFGWSPEPPDDVRIEVHRTVARYLDHCRQTGRVATLPDMVRELARWRQEPGVRVRDQGRPLTRDGPRSNVGETLDALRLAQERLRARERATPTSEAL